MSIAKIKDKKSNIKNSKDSSIVKKFEIIGNAKSTPTIIARDLAIEGDLTSSGLIEVEGGINGTIRGNSVILREDGLVNGTIIANNLNIRAVLKVILRHKISVFLARQELLEILNMLYYQLKMVLR